MTANSGFWRGKRVFVTGHTGFKGAWLCAWLDRLGARVFGLSLPPESATSLCSLIGLDQSIGSLHADIRDAERLHEAMAGFVPDIVLHLAAQSLVRRSYRDPAGTFATNVMGTVNLLEAVRKTPSVRAVVVVTSDKCYENREWVWPYRETEALGGADPYSASKAGAELVAQAWRQSFFGADQPAAVATARAGNVIGGGDWAEDRLIPDCIAALTAGRPIEIRNPAATRPWQHVLDPLAGYLTLAERLVTQGQGFARAWNFGPANEDIRPVAAIADAVTARWGEGARWIATGMAGPHEAGLLAVDASLARARLGWAPRLRLDEALNWTVDWYRRQHAGEPAETLVAQQIEAYEALP
ncbi:MAG: CDP-glucose 4,6-dehydratase [Aliidongia sp.]